MVRFYFNPFVLFCLVYGVWVYRNKNLRFKIYITIIFSVAFVCVCETWSLAVRKEHTLVMFEDWGAEVQEAGENYIMVSLLICILLQG
jgi:hypothetical protein